MATRDTGQPVSGITRRDFLKTTAAATAVVGCGLEFAYDPEKAQAYENSASYKVTFTTCPYCSASCGQRVVTRVSDGVVVDIYGDFESPMNSGGLCAKGAGALQLVNNSRRIGAWPTSPHPTGHAAFVATTAALGGPSANWTAAGLPAYTAGAAAADGVAYFRLGNQEWEQVPLNEAMKAAAARMYTARGGAFGASAAGDILAAPMTIDSVAYTGFSNLGIVARADGKYFVGTGGCKVDAATLGTAIAALPGDTTGIAAAFDDLVWLAEKPKDYTTWTFVGRSNLKSLVFGRTGSPVPDSIDIVRDGATYYAYVATVSFATAGTTLVYKSSDFITWTFVSDIGAPAGTFGMVNPSVMKSGSKLKVWHNSFSAVGTYDYSLYYSEFDGTVWNTAAAVTIGGAASTGAGHPYVTFTGTTYSMWYNDGANGIRVAEAPFTTPAAFAAGSAVLYHNPAVPARQETCVVALPTDLIFADSDPADPLGYAFAKIRAFKGQAHNSKSVAFFGSSHMNNESNYIYRKMIANFGTSNVEHQARI